MINSGISRSFESRRRGRGGMGTPLRLTFSRRVLRLPRAEVAKKYKTLRGAPIPPRRLRRARKQLLDLGSAGESWAGLATWAWVGGLRIRWVTLGKGMALAGVGLLALQVVPSLLRPPKPPPLAGDVGLPRVKVEPADVEAPPKAETPSPTMPKPRRHRHLPKSKNHPGLRGGTASSKPTPRRHLRKKKKPKPKQMAAPERSPAAPAPPPPSSPPASSPPPTLEPSPAPPPASSPPPPPEPAPSANDGSVEFAPH